MNIPASEWREQGKVFAKTLREWADIVEANPECLPGMITTPRTEDRTHEHDKRQQRVVVGHDVRLWFFVPLKEAKP